MWGWMEMAQEEGQRTGAREQQVPVLPQKAVRSRACSGLVMSGALLCLGLGVATFINSNTPSLAPSPPRPPLALPLETPLQSSTEATSSCYCNSAQSASSAHMYIPPEGQILRLHDGQEICAIGNVIRSDLLRFGARQCECDSGGLGPWGALILSAPPKAGSTLLRALISLMSPSYRNAKGMLKGEENGAQLCSEQRAHIAGLLESSATKGTLSASFVRAPISRFLSGIREELLTGCEKWLRWRKERRRIRSNLEAGSSLVCHPFFGQQTSVGLTTPTQYLLWDTAEGWPLITHTFILDVEAGYTTEHIDRQCESVQGFHRVAALNMLIRLEHAQTDWDLFMQSAGLAWPKWADVMDAQGASAAHSHVSSSDHERTTAANTFHNTTWPVVCRHLTVDFACFANLGQEYLPPAECHATFSAG